MEGWLLNIIISDLHVIAFVYPAVNRSRAPTLLGNGNCHHTYRGKMEPFPSGFGVLWPEFYLYYGKACMSPLQED